MNSPDLHKTQTVEELFRQESGRIQAVLTGLFGFDASDEIEDIIQDTFLTAMKVWPVKGYPDNPGAWLIQVAKHKLINLLKSESNRNRLLREYSINEAFTTEEVHIQFQDQYIKDAQLKVLAACCDPVLSDETKVMLTLKIVSGFSNREIAAALFKNEDAVRKAIYRARKSLSKESRDILNLKSSRIIDQFDIILKVIYLIFNEGYKPEGNKIVDEDLCHEALRLAFLVEEMAQSDHHKAEIFGLLSLMYFILSRFEARTAHDNRYISIKEQDRKLWDRELMQSGFYFLSKSRKLNNDPGLYILQALIQSFHARAENFERTDWKSIKACYDELIKKDQSEPLMISYAIAVNHAIGPKESLNILDEVFETKGRNTGKLLLLARAEVYVSMKHYQKAKSLYMTALDYEKSEFDRNHLLKKIQDCDRMIEHLN